MSTSEAKKEHKHPRYNYASGLLWFIIIWIFIVLILWATKPKFIRRKDKGHGKNDDHGDHHDKHQVDLGKAVLWAFIIALIIILIFWVFLYAGTGGYGNDRSSARRWDY